MFFLKKILEHSNIFFIVLQFLKKLFENSPKKNIFLGWKLQ
jgi:hypothetical protein